MFETGKTYAARSICDHNCVFTITIAKRTAKTVTTTDGKLLRIWRDMDGNEAVWPLGWYSMAPIIRGLPS